MKILFLILIFLNIESFGVDKFLKKQNIIDIGHSQESREIQVPMEKIAKEPNIKLISNTIVYSKRVESPKFDCETDFLGTETCPKEENICPSVSEYTDGYSVVHHSQKTYLKICSPSEILDGKKCYLDKNNDGIKDSAYFIRSGGYVWSNYFLNLSKSISREDTVNVKPYGYIEARHYSAQACDDDNNHVVVKVNNSEKIDTWCNASKDTGLIEIYRNDTSSTETVSYYLFDGHSGGGWDASNMILYIYNLNMDIPAGYTAEKNGDIINFYKDSICPNGSTEQDDGTCALQYDWYSYVCPNDLNDYKLPWTVINEGGDCGDPSCTNSQIPPNNNCVRVKYSCPLDSSIKCGKTENTVGFCENGYVWNSNRCERIETFCGDSIYNAALDVCQDVTKYSKLCKEIGEVYDAVKNKCINSSIACVDGVYSEKYNKCMMDFIADCNTTGYVYNPISDVCENKTEPLCEMQYNYNSERGICVGEMTICSTGYIYNEKTNKCEQELCGVLGTKDDGSECATEVICDGIVTPEGTCIPNTVR